MMLKKVLFIYLMALLWCFVALSMISVLGSIIECDSMVLNTDSAGPNKENATGKVLDRLENSTVKIPEKQFVSGDATGNVGFYSIDGFRKQICLPDEAKVRSDGVAAGSVNTPIRAGECYCPTPDSKPQNCTYFLQFGKFEDGLTLIANERHRKPKNSTAPFTVVLEYPQMEGLEDYNVAYIYLGDSEASKNIYDDVIVMKKGGIGSNHFELEIKSQVSRPHSYRMMVYIKHRPWNL